MNRNGEATLASEVYGALTFTGERMRRYLPADAYEQI